MKPLVLFTFLCLSNITHAENNTKFDESTSFADESHHLISRQLHAWIDGVDQFFGEERAMERQNSSQLLVRMQATRYDDKFTWEPKLRARLDLPRSKRRLRLMLSSEAFGERSDDLDAVELSTQESIQESLDNSSFSAALQFVLAQTDLFDVHTRGGVSYMKGPDPFMSLTGSAQTQFEKWNFRITEDVFLYARQGFGQDMILDIERKLFDRVLVRLNSNFNWWQEFKEFHSIQTASLIVPITQKFAISLVGISEQRPQQDWQVEANYLYSILRYRFYKHWAYIQMKPQIQYLREDDFTPQWSVTTGLEMIFGKKRDQAEDTKTMIEP